MNDVHHKSTRWTLFFLLTRLWLFVAEAFALFLVIGALSGGRLGFWDAVLIKVAYIALRGIDIRTWTHE